MADTALRPRSTSEILDAAFSLLRQNYSRFVSITAIAYLPWLVVMMLLGRSIGSDGGAVGTGAIILAIFGMLGFIVWFPIMNAAVVLAASESYLGRPIVVAHVMREALGKFGRILVAVALRGIAYMIGLIFFIIPGIYLYLRYFAAPAAIVVENRGSIESLERSAQLTNGQKMRMLGTLVLTYIIYILVLLIGMIPSALVENVLIENVISAVVTILAWPMVALVETLIYYDLRIRQEGYDIELMAQELGEPPLTQPA